MNDKQLTLAFPVLAMLISLIAYSHPDPWLDMGSWIVPLLSLIMFCMGLTLSPDDFKRVVNRKRVVGLGVALQFLVMPIAALLIARSLGLSTELLVGMLLVGCAPGGTASNVICFLARADVALSISLTLVSTLLASFLLPGLTLLYLDKVVPVPVAGMFFSAIKIVLIPVMAGVLLNRVLPRIVSGLQNVLPLFTVMAIVLIIGIIVALNATKLGMISAVVIVAVACHNLIGLLVGYLSARLLGHSPQIARTLAIEVGMQNSGLAVALAVKHFSPLAALPGAVFSIWHNLSGSLLAAWWNKNQSNNKDG